MKKILSIILKAQGVSFLILGLLQGCAPTKVSENFIPKDASFVINVNLKNISNKADNWKDLFGEEMNKSLDEFEEINDLIGKILQSGNVDLNVKAHIFSKLEKDTKASYAASLLIYSGSMEKVAGYLKNKMEVKTDGKLKYIFDKESGLLISLENANLLLVKMDDKTEEKILVSKSKELRAVKKADGLSANNKVYEDLEKQSADISFWLNSASIAQYADDKDKSSLLQANQYLTGVMNFEKGEAVMNLKTFYDENTSKKYEGLLKDNINSEILNGVSLPSPAILMALGVGSQSLYNILQENKGLDEVNKFAKDLKVDSKELFELWNGDAIVGIKDLQLASLFAADDAESEIVIGLGIAKKEILDKILKAADDKYAEMSKDGDLYTFDSEYSKVKLFYKNNVLYITSSPKILKDIQDGKGSMGDELNKLAKGNSFMTILDFKPINDQIPGLSEQLTALKNDVLPQLGKFTLTVNSIKNNISESKISITTTSKDKNSLFVLINVLKTGKSKLGI